MPSLKNKYLVETDWLADHLDAPDLVVFDASWYLPAMKRDARQEYATGHIPGALFFDIDDLSDEKSALPHMLPSTTKFATRMKKMGVGDGMRIVVYDGAGLFSAPRAWWTFRVMGHEDVAVLNGGFKKWNAEGRAVSDEIPRARTPRHFTPRFNAALLRDKADIAALITSKSAQIVDARPPGRFAGTDPEPRAGLRSGHIPGSRNLPASSLLNGDGTMKDAIALAQLLATAGVDANRPIVTSCGSGVSACVVSLALAVAGHDSAAVYDGSWSEWGADPSVPVATGSGAKT